MNKNNHIREVPHYQSLLDLLAEVYSSLNGDYPELKQKIKEVLEQTEPSKLYEREST